MYHEFLMPYVKLMSIVNKHLHKEVFEKKKIKLENSCLFDEFVCKLGLFWHVWAILHTNELNTTFFGSTSPLKAPNRLKSLKLA
jgi:hypothetical protein